MAVRKPLLPGGPGAGSSRRELLGSLVALALGDAACRRLGFPRQVRREGARFAGFPIWRVDSFLTPTSDFFVRDHFGVPAAAHHLHPWTLRVEGDVDRPFTLSLEELARETPVELPVTLECAGNAGRNGVGWPGAGRAYGGASSALFQGFPIAPLLARAGVRPGVVEVVFEGADEGTERGDARARTFAEAVPLEAALAPSAMLATRMNGAPLPALHGGPVRALFPGRYATDSVKWLARIRAIDQPFDGYYATRRYRRASPADPVGRPVGELRVQSEIAHPRPGDKLPAGLAVDVLGVAWGGHGGAARVEISVDGGRSFASATFLDPANPFCWRRFRYTWIPRVPGPRLVLARATDAGGTSQPFASDEDLGLGYSISGPDRMEYENNSAPIVPVTVG